MPEEVQSLPGLTILRDGIEIERAVWSVPIPVDTGTHQIVMTATDKKSEERAHILARAADRSGVRARGVQLDEYGPFAQRTGEEPRRAEDEREDR